MKRMFRRWYWETRRWRACRFNVVFDHLIKLVFSYAAHFFWWFLDCTKLRTYGVEQVFKWASFCQQNLVSLCGSIHWLLVLSCFVISSWVLFICHNYDDIIKVILFFFWFKWKTKTKQSHHAMSSWDEWLSSCFIPLPRIKCYSNHNYFFFINS